MLKSINVVIRKGPSLEQATLGVRAAWAMLTEGGYDVNIIFMGDGVYSLLPRPGYLSGLLSRFIAEEGKVYALSDSVDERGLDMHNVLPGVDLVTEKNVPALMAGVQAITVY